jgi:two-component system nitrogen regulation response regulator GlnG
MATLLIVDDEPNLLYALEKRLRSETLEVHTAQTANEGLGLVETKAPDAVILDIRLPDMGGLDAFDRIRELDPALPVIFITGSSTTETAIEAIKRGAYEYLLKPVDLAKVQEVVGKAIELRRGPPALPLCDGVQQPASEVDRLVGRSAAMQGIYKAIGRVASEDMPVLILGESGTGKELVAHAIARHSNRSGGPFLAINCAAIPETLLESELFGHERGAFTGADRRRIGKFEQANGGTIFLDEIADMTPAIQAKVLRLLQEQRFERLGGSETVQTDVRVIAATNQNLEAMVTSRRFRKDLLYRLNVFTIRLPPLRERTEDLPMLIEHFVRRASQKARKPMPSLCSETLRLLQAYDWPGNVRELQSTIKSALVLARGNVVTPDCLPDSVRHPGGASVSAAGSQLFDLTQFVRDLLRSGASEIYEKASAEFDRILLAEVLQHVKGHQVHASEMLGISRNTLRAKLRSLGLSFEKQLAESGPDEQDSLRA